MCILVQQKLKSKSGDLIHISYTNAYKLVTRTTALLRTTGGLHVIAFEQDPQMFDIINIEM